MSDSPKNERARIPALKVRQWLPVWDKVDFTAAEHRKKPDPFFYMFSMSASRLRALSGIQRRDTTNRLHHGEDLGIQRRHDESRSSEIRNFIKFGYPWSELSEAKRQLGEYNSLRKPGWLPTAVVVNILAPEDVRGRDGSTVDRLDLITVNEEGERYYIELPNGSMTPGWQIHSTVPPIEVIDGQHRLWACDKDDFGDQFEIPVVAFHGLDISWQAYQFWTINVKPKKINASLAFDLYPLLRTEDWLDKFEGHPIYRETRSQELVQHLWSHPDSPWHQRINMLGEPGLGGGQVSQSSWIRSLMATFVKRSDGRKIGGLFGSRTVETKEVIPWSRTQQTAFLILVGAALRESIKTSHYDWAVSIRESEPQASFVEDIEPAFEHPTSLLTTDVGIRGLLFVSNDLTFLLAGELDLSSWTVEELSDGGDRAISNALESLRMTKVGQFLKDLAEELAAFDWRTSQANGLSKEETTQKKALRGSGGYREVRRLILEHLASSKSDRISGTAKQAITILDIG